MEDINNKKAKIRKELVERRNSLTVAEIQQKTQKFTENFLSHKEVMEIISKSSGSIAIYFPMGNELSLIPLAKKIEKLQGKKFCLPVVCAKNAPLKFASWDLDEKSLAPGKIYKTILEPLVEDESSYVIPSVILLPLAGFDSQNRRLGMGAGFYDMTIAHYKKTVPNPITTIGVGYDIQEIDKIPVDEWDEVLDFVVIGRE
jgi:5-formyltetrahydrofolate cyclo-ligase